MQQSLVLLVDIVGSKRLDDRIGAHEGVLNAFRRAHVGFGVARQVWSTAGDEFQSTYPSLAVALSVTALVRLTLPDGLDCRFGVGYGEVQEIDSRPDGAPIQDGSAWWNAREAIGFAHKHEHHRHPYLRTWFVSDDRRDQAVVNAYLLQRDHTLSRMKARERRIAAGMLEGKSQANIADEERISQAAVSQTLQRSGATALMTGLGLLRDWGNG